MTSSTTAQKPDALPVVAWLTTWNKDRVRGSGSLLSRVEPQPKYDCNAYDPLVRLSDAQAALLAKEAECEALRAAIRDHNNDCESRCEQRQQDGDVHCPYAKYGRQCPDCPRDGMVDAAIDAARAAADQGGAS